MPSAASFKARAEAQHPAAAGCGPSARKGAKRPYPRHELRGVRPSRELSLALEVPHSRGASGA
eukprot:15432083-Alexandrium_andersonii.AAC.1